MEHIVTASIVTIVFVLVLLIGIAIGLDKSEKQIDLIKLEERNKGFDNGYRACKLVMESKVEYRRLFQ